MKKGDVGMARFAKKYGNKGQSESYVKMAVSA